MAFFTVDNGVGTRSAAGGTTQLTGTLASQTATDIWSTLAGAIAGGGTPPTAGDHIVIAQGHTETFTVNTTFAIPDGVFVWTADESALETPLAATVANLHASSNDDLIFSGDFHCFGLYVKADDDLIMCFAARDCQVWEEATFEVNGSSDKVTVCSGNGTSSVFINCDIILPSGGLIYLPSNGGNFRMIGGTVDAGTTTQVLQTIGSTRGGRARFENVNFSNYATQLFTAPAVNYGYTLEIINCTILSAKSLIGSTSNVTQDQEILISGCGDTNDRSWQLYYRKGQSYAEMSSANVRTGSENETIDAQAIALKCVTGSDCSLAKPFIIDLTGAFFEFTDNTADALEAYILASSTTNQDEMSLRVASYDFTDKFTLEVVDTKETLHKVTPTALDAGAQTWTDETGKTDYKIVADTNATSADGVPTNLLIVTKASADFFLCSEFGAVGV